MFTLLCRLTQRTRLPAWLLAVRRRHCCFHLAGLRNYEGIQVHQLIV